MQTLFDDIVDPRTGQRMREITLAVVDPDSTTVYIRITNDFEWITARQSGRDNMT